MTRRELARRDRRERRPRYSSPVADHPREIVVPGTVDPIGTGWVKSLARPGGNITGFTLMEFSIFGKLLDLLKRLAPDTVRVGLVFNPDNPSSLRFRREIATFAGRLGIEPVVFPIHGLADIDRAIATLAERPNSAVFFLPDITVLAMAEQVVELGNPGNRGKENAGNLSNGSWAAAADFLI